jgi:hypothetical protein
MKVIAVKERSAGDGYGHGSEWVETATFEPDAKLADVLAWAADITADPVPRACKYGRLMLTVAHEPDGGE